MSLPLISCIVPVFNGERYLREALDSIFAQTYPRLEVIVVDDGSTDDTATLVAAFADRVHSLRQSNQGPAAARNLGLGAAKGEFIAFLDADDLWHPEKLERQMTRFLARAELDYCVAHAQNFWIPELSEEHDKFRDHRIAKELPAYVTGSLLVRRELLTRIGFFDPSLGHGDSMEWFLRAAEHGAVGELMSDVLLYRRLHHTNRVRQLAAASRNEFLRIIKASIDHRRQSNRKC
jgi:glycosyltransferase involved in cell wall biosynthesis